MSHFRSVAFPKILALMWALSGCVGTRGPSLPDVSVEQSQIAERSQRLERIRQVMSEDLAEFEALRVQVSAHAPGFFARPFPLDLFKHVAIECLNEPWDPNQLETTDSGPSDTGDLGLLCRPEFGDRLFVDLEERVPQRRQKALVMLENIDKLRQLRGKLRQRISRIPEISRASQSLLATRRADLRQTRTSYARRRTEYSDERWQKLERRLAAFEEDLGELEDQIERLQQVFPGWSPALDQSVSMLYMELAQLSP
jgi:hypothetical protein